MLQDLFRKAEALEIESYQLFSAEVHYEEIIKQFQEHFLSEIGATASEAAYAKIAELKKNT